jgi:hypothetical protein
MRIIVCSKQRLGMLLKLVCRLQLRCVLRLAFCQKLREIVCQLRTITHLLDHRIAGDFHHHRHNRDCSKFPEEKGHLAEDVARMNASNYRFRHELKDGAIPPPTAPRRMLDCLMNSVLIHI